MTQIGVTREDLDDLGRKLDAADLTDKERQVLLAVFAIAGEAVDAREVSGFSFSFGGQAAPGGQLSLAGGLSAPFENSFIQGNRGGVPGEGTHAIVIEL
ncbi:MAG TPA: hypothetical protein VMU09_12840 [Acidimicrobiales bacterium]|nr:hypothetical protein [Acidimicrobiales bacterium]